MLALQWLLFDFGERDVRVEVEAASQASTIANIGFTAVHQDADRASTHLARSREEAVRQIVTAHNTLQKSLAAHAAAKELLATTQTTYDAAFDAYRHGVGSITDALLA